MASSDSGLRINPTASISSEISEPCRGFVTNAEAYIDL